jgi:hypothetical protein
MTVNSSRPVNPVLGRPAPIGQRFIFQRRVRIGFALCLISIFFGLVALKQLVLGSKWGTPLATSSTQLRAVRSLAKTTLTYTIIPAPNHTWCYDIFADGKLMIHQTSIPAVPGHKGFNTGEVASKVALLVIEKIKRGERPPTISIEEMKQLSLIE